MKTTYYVINHSRGNHSPEQVYHHGSVDTEGTKKECIERLSEMRKWCREKWSSVSTNDKKRDWVAYQMGDIFFVKNVEGRIEWA